MFIASLLASQTENKFVTFGLMFMKLTDIIIAEFLRLSLPNFQSLKSTNMSLSFLHFFQQYWNIVRYFQHIFNSVFLIIKDRFIGCSCVESNFCEGSDTKLSTVKTFQTAGIFQLEI